MHADFQCGVGENGPRGHAPEELEHVSDDLSRALGGLAPDFQAMPGTRLVSRRASPQALGCAVYGADLLRGNNRLAVAESGAGVPDDGPEAPHRGIRSAKENLPTVRQAAVAGNKPLEVLEPARKPHGPSLGAGALATAGIVGEGAPDPTGPIVEGLHLLFYAVLRNQPILSRSTSERNGCASSCCPM